MIGEWQIFGTVAAEFTERVVSRVNGGFQNRWLIRHVEYRPNKNHIIIHEGQRQIYCHPALVAEIRKALPAPRYVYGGSDGT